MNQNQEQVVVTKITFHDVKEVEGGKVLVFSREYSDGAKDIESQTPIIKDEEFEKYVNVHIESFNKSIVDNEKFLKGIEDLVLANREHLNAQIEFLSNVLIPEAVEV